MNPIRLLRAKSSFTIIELMIVVGIVGLIATLLVPNVIRGRMAANEGAAMAALRTIATAVESFKAVQTPPAYPANLNGLCTADPPYISRQFTEGATVQGYTYSLDSEGGEFVLSCIPSRYAVSGSRTFAIVEGGILKAKEIGVAIPQPTHEGDHDDIESALNGWVSMVSF